MKLTHLDFRSKWVLTMLSDLICYYRIWKLAFHTTFNITDLLWLIPVACTWLVPIWFRDDYHANPITNIHPYKSLLWRIVLRKLSWWHMRLYVLWKVYTCILVVVVCYTDFHFFLLSSEQWYNDCMWPKLYFIDDIIRMSRFYLSCPDWNCKMWLEKFFLFFSIALFFQCGDYLPFSIGLKVVNQTHYCNVVFSYAWFVVHQSCLTLVRSIY